MSFILNVLYRNNPNATTWQFFVDLIFGVLVLPSMVHNSLTTMDFDRYLYSEQELAVFASVEVTNSTKEMFFGVAAILSSFAAVYR